MTHGQYDSLSLAERAAYDALEDIDFTKSCIHVMIKNNMHSAPRFRLMLLTLNDMIQDNAMLIEQQIGATSMALVVAAVGCECDGFCYHETTI